jgi:hypothetical protein
MSEETSRRFKEVFAGMGDRHQKDNSVDRKKIG